MTSKIPIEFLIGVLSCKTLVPPLDHDVDAGSLTCQCVKIIDAFFHDRCIAQLGYSLSMSNMFSSVVPKKSLVISHSLVLSLYLNINGVIHSDRALIIVASATCCMQRTH